MSRCVVIVKVSDIEVASITDKSLEFDPRGGNKREKELRRGSHF